MESEASFGERARGCSVQTQSWIRELPVWRKAFRWQFLAVFVITLVVASCGLAGRPAMELEEAKKITADIGGEPVFTPPPRRIADVVEHLDRVSGVGTKALLSRANLAVPASASKETLARFYVARAEAARMLGRYDQAIADGLIAVETSSANRSSAHLALGAAYDELGYYQLAADHYSRAAEQAPFYLTAINANALLGMVYAEMGDFERADLAIARAMSKMPDTYEVSQGSAWAPFSRAVAFVNQGMVAAFRGAYEDAEASLRKALQELQTDIAEHPWPDNKISNGHRLRLRREGLLSYARRVLAGIVLKKGRLAEAEALARDALFEISTRVGRYSGQTAEALDTLTDVLLDRGRFEEAATLASLTIDVYGRMGADKDSMTWADARRRLADAYVGQRRWAEALKLYDGIAADLSGDHVGSWRVSGTYRTWAIALIESGRAREAVERLRPVRDRLTELIGEDRYETAETSGLLAAALAVSGEEQAALDGFLEALPVLLSRSKRSSELGSTATAGELRLQFILESYLRLLSDRVHTGRPGAGDIEAINEAFEFAQVARGGSVQRALSASAARKATRDSGLADLARREQDAVYRISALNALLIEASGSEGNATERLFSRIEELEGARAVIMDELQRRFPDYAELIDPPRVTADEARAILRPGEALVAFYVGEDRTYVWAVPQAGSVQFAVAKVGREDLADKVARLRAALDPKASTLGDIPAFEVQLAYELYAALLKPVESGWKQAKSLVVVPHKALGYLPLSVLPTEPVALATERKPLFSNYREVPWLARSHAVTVLPSVASLRTLREVSTESVGDKPLVAFADPIFSPGQAAAGAAPGEVQVASADNLGAVRGIGVSLRSAPATRGLRSAQLASLPPLPDTAHEALAIATALNADPSSVVLGAEANEHRVKTMNLVGFRVIAFATHGLVPGDLDGLGEPALALSSPAVSGTSGDGLLTMGEILGLRLNADWVVLSACNTAAGQGAGAEAVSGLGRAFFFAGSRALLVSNWPVHSPAATDLITGLFRLHAETRSLSRAEALRQAMMQLIEEDGYVDAKGRSLFSYAHPLFWAPFTIVGDGGGGAAVGS